MVLPVDFFASNFRALTLKTKTKQIERGRKDGREARKEAERKEDKKRKNQKSTTTKKTKHSRSNSLSLLVYIL